MRKEREWKSRALDSRNRDKNCSFLVFSMFCHSSYGRKVPDDHYHPMDSCWLFSMLMRWAVGVDELKLIEYDKWILPVHVCVCFFPYLNWLKIIFLMMIKSVWYDWFICVSIMWDLSCQMGIDLFANSSLNQRYDYPIWFDRLFVCILHERAATGEPSA